MSEREGIHGMKGRRDDGHVVALLDRYRTGELEVPVREQVEGHLAGCPACAAELAALTGFAATVGRGYAAEETRAAASAPDWDRQRQVILARTRRPSAGHPAPRGARWAPQAALAVIALVALGVLYTRGVRGPAEAERALAPPVERAPSTTGRVEPSDSMESADLSASARPRPPAPSGPRMDRDTSRREAHPGPETEAAAPAAGGVPAVQEPTRDERVEEEIAVQETEFEPKAAATAADRFEARGRTALTEGDRPAASQALAFWRDSLARGETLSPNRRAPLQALADSLAVLVASRP